MLQKSNKDHKLIKLLTESLAEEDPDIILLIVWKC